MEPTVELPVVAPPEDGVPPLEPLPEVDAAPVDGPPVDAPVDAPPADDVPEEAEPVLVELPVEPDDL